MTQPWPQTPAPGGPPELPPWWPEPDQDRGPGRLRTWLAADPAAHGMIAGTPALWMLGGVLHEMGCTYQWGAAGTVACAATTAAVCQWIAARPVPEWADPPETIGAVEGAASVLAAGGWVTAAAVYGAGWPGAGGPHWLLTAALAGLATGAWYGWLRSHDAVQAARARRADKRTWEERKAFWDDLTRRVADLNGCDVIDHVVTLVGEQVCLDTRGTGRLASQIRTRAVEERIGELWHPRIPRGRIDCWLDDFPGRIWITVRSRDPWKYPVHHPLIDPRSIAARYMPAETTARRPLVLGLDPEDGEPFGLTTGPGPAGLPVWIPDQGGQVILVAATKGGGKTNLLSVLTERLTACMDCRVLQVNLTAPAEMRAFAPACPANALGRHELGRARAILAWVERYCDDWADRSDEAHATPSQAREHLAVIIDEVADVAEDPVCKARMRGIVRKCRKAGVTLVIAGQRGTATWIGGADVRAMIDLLVVGRFTQPGEIDKIAGVHLDLPDLSSYGGGAAGVVMIVNRATGDYGRGRSVLLKHPRDMARIARDRAHRGRWTPPGMPEDQAELWEVITTADDVPLDAWEGPVAGGDDEDTAPPVLTTHLPEPSGPADPDEERWYAVIPPFDVAGVPPNFEKTIVAMIRRSAGASAGEVGHAIAKSRETARKYLNLIAAAGHARTEGEGRHRRYYAAERPPLLVLDGSDEKDGDVTRDD